MSEVKLFARIHSTKELGKGKLIIDIEIVSLNEKGIIPNIDFIIKCGTIEKKRTTNNSGFYRNDEFFENIKNLKVIELLINEKELISTYFIKNQENIYQIEDIIIDDMDEMEYIIWNIDENEEIKKGQIIATVIGLFDWEDDEKGVETVVEQIKAKKNGILLSKFIGRIEEFKYKDKESMKKITKHRIIPKGKKVYVDIKLEEKFVIGQFATYEQ